MGLLCSKTKGLPQVINKSISSPKAPQLKAPTVPSVPNVGELKVQPKASPKKPSTGVVSNILQTAAGVAMGNIIGQKISRKLDNTNNSKDVENPTQSPIEKDKYSVGNELENKEITGQDEDLNEQDELTEHNNFDDDDHNDEQEESDD
ncbi:uncharacterized protein LOC114125271 [Aphis gossypii]|uniref:Uncharacterized protein n=1 Tax=Aphis gossypii TaxID=80765 RepID=A0A9P0IWK9_APHGO|nr:uncharacterized protein LOC114125271 [Aphis gossypii]CAH1722168.1 unnamed protein product [Aphis gossypii]